MERFFTWPNAITVFRMFLGVYGVYLASFPGHFSRGALIISIAIALDLADGFIARRINQISRLGEFLDPFVDKVIFYSVIGVLFTKDVWIPGFIVLFFCDMISTVLHFSKSGGAVKSGKIKFNLQIITLGLFAIGKVYGMESMIIMANATLLFATCFAVHSLVIRFKK